eukprot:g36177.t1
MQVPMATPLVCRKWEELKVKLFRVRTSLVKPMRVSVEGDWLGLRERKKRRAFRPNAWGMQVYRDWMSIVKMRGGVMIEGAVGGGVRELAPGFGDVMVSAPYHYYNPFICRFDGEVMVAADRAEGCVFRWGQLGGNEDNSNAFDVVYLNLSKSLHQILHETPIAERRLRDHMIAVDKSMRVTKVVNRKKLFPFYHESDTEHFVTMLGDIISEASNKAMLFYSAWNLYCLVRY